MGSTIIGIAEREEAIRLLAADGQERELKTQALTVIERAKAITITDQRSYDVACALLLGEIKPFRKRWESYWHGTDENPGPIKLAYKSYKSLLEKYNEADKPAEEAEKTVKAATVVWEQEQDRIKERLQREAQEKAEAEERERQLQAAVVAEQSGASEEEVEAIISAPLAIVAAPVAPTFQRAVGMSKPRANWKCVVTDLKKLCAAIGKGQVPLNYVEPNETALNARARADESTMSIPGCIAKNFPIASGRTK